MVNLPSSYVIGQTLVVGRIYRISAPELIETKTPHFFIVVAIDGNDIYLVKGTSQKEMKEALYERNGFDLVSLVCVKDDGKNQLKTETYINCHDYYYVTRDQLIKKVDDSKLDLFGEISYDQFCQIRTGIEKSPINDLPISLLVHPDDN